MADEDTGEAPVVHGYFREHMFMGAREKAEIRTRLQQSAARRGYRLAKVFEEKLDTTPRAFGALLAAAVTDGAAVIVPGLEHFAIHGHPLQIRKRVAEAIGRRVLVADP